ncbi:MAG TPA: hypothetical protein VHW23_11640 [Kofleriaceae bacterium]|jgi:hypothetical protein|nr:hypothetical protein [Kofleriaceae bacterium]
MDAVLSTRDARLLCPLCFTKADITAARRRGGFDGGAVALIGAASAALPFLARAASWAVAAQARPDWIALAAGIVAAACGASTIVAARARASGAWLAVGALVVVLAGYHLARAVGLIG